MKDAQRHGLHFLPVDVTQSDWLCTVVQSRDREGASSRHCVRLGLNYVKGLREEAARAILAARSQSPFTSIQDLVDRVPQLRKDELRRLAQIGALNPIQEMHRRESLWESDLAVRPRGELLIACDPPSCDSPLAPMTDSERLNADFHGTHLTIGKHPMAYHREAMDALGVIPANRLKHIRNGKLVRTAGCIICRQRPGTAKGLVFLSVEDETGVSNAVIMPDVFDRQRATLLENSYLVIEGELQNIDNVVSVKVSRLQPLHVAEAAVPSHDFH